MRAFARLWLSSIALGILCGPISAQTAVERLDEGFVKDTLALDPVGATLQGYHRHGGVSLDSELTDYSRTGASHAIAVYTDYLKRVNDLAQGNISPEDRADLDVIRLQCESQLLDLRDIQSYRHNPTMYVEMIGNALYYPLIQNYAPENDRLGQIVARLQKVPAAIAAARQSLTGSPGIWIDVAVEENTGNIELIDREIRSHITPNLKASYDAAAAPALDALRSFSAFLQKDLNRGWDWRLGGRLYGEKFKLMLATGDTPQRTLADAQAKLQSLREDMGRQARTVFPKYFPGRTAPGDLNSLVSAVLDKVAQQHTTPERYLDDAKNDLGRITGFVNEKRLLPLPEGKNLRVIPTPEFMRGIYGVGGFAPAPALEPELGAFYWITPFTKNMSRERIESKLREYNHWGLEILTIHEAMPGHYVQFEYAAKVEPKWRGVLRQLYGNTPYIEGWAVYATQLVIEAGFEDTPEMRLTFGKQMLRVVANTILDVGLQTGGMTDEQAMDLMINQTFQEKEEAQKKLQRAKLSSCQLPTYFVGWRGWNQLRKDLSGSDFIERALRQGAVPLPILRDLLLSRQ